MIGRLTKKDKIALVYITLLTLFAVVYGFSIIPSPLRQQILAYDQQRVVDLGEIQSSVEDYYQTNNTLPNSLDDLSNTYDSSNQLDITDPQTKQPYEYTILNPTSYQLCAVFTHSSLNEKQSPEETTSVANYPAFSYQFKHPAGHYCFTKQIPFSMYNNPPQTQPLIPSHLYKQKITSPSSYSEKPTGK